MSEIVIASDSLSANEEFDLEELSRSLKRPRTLLNILLTTLAGAVTLTGLLPLFSVLWTLIIRGGSRLRLELFTELPPTGAETGGGFGNCLLGSFIMVGLAFLIAAPFGILAAIYLAEFGKDSKMASTVRFCAKTMTGFPSILAGVIAFAVIVEFIFHHNCALAGAVALSLLMIPTIMLTAEEAIKMVPARMKEAAIGMGATPTQVAWKITLPAAFPGILTGMMLAIARAAGETAPLLFTAMFYNYWFTWSWKGITEDRTASISVFIFNYATSAFSHHQDVAWAAALVLVGVVLAMNVAAQLVARRQQVR
ncbi:phosphate ABC transporter permease PstA [Lignipirellula cremea]|uniref:Phosphate transport system permease protein PstA n=1 Tax=Lignipirellula cremea TaxID=2528010 RepID=A0A518DPZ6_9BACT|nr:phosphate ABC transporter permease PstA [Lignipirellula cremea]QDU93898.1 Phosphate transport system permease protein PstA [Lignipirellula cremea]